MVVEDVKQGKIRGNTGNLENKKNKFFHLEIHYTFFIKKIFSEKTKKSNVIII